MPDPLPVSPDNPPWNSWAALGVWALSVVFIILFPNLFLLPYLMTLKLNFADQVALVEFAKTDPTAVLLQITAIIPAHIFTLVLAWLVVTRFRKFSFRKTLGWRWNGFSVWNCLIILGGFYILAAIISYFSPEQENDLMRILQSSRTAVYVVAFLATFTAPLVEEVVYRGILYSAFQRAFGVPATVFFVTLLFAVVHVPQYYPSYSTIFLICLLSLTLTLIRVRTKNLLPCIALHTAFNGTQSLLMILQPLIQKYIETHPTDSAILIHLLK
ncbi:MAG: CPBP family intramembrane glutamic endopeptidase [Pyrinomonadaceae bacterium]